MATNPLTSELRSLRDTAADELYCGISKVNPFKLELLIVTVEDRGLQRDAPSRLLAVMQMRYCLPGWTFVELISIREAGGLPGSPFKVISKEAVLVDAFQANKVTE
jgi:hypothetical protein